MTTTSSAGVQIGALVRTFLLRFFESELTSTPDDLKTTFFWLLAFLAVPGLVIPVDLSFAWTLRATLEGVEGLRVASRGEKAFYLGFAMIASGTLSVIAWGSLLVDRRDGLILGALPVRPLIVLTAKLAALAAYIALVAAAMHTLASVSFGFFLASRGTVGFALQGIVAHFVAASASSAFILLAVVALQGSVLALFGPRLYARAAPVLQTLVVGGIAAGCLVLPLVDISTVSTLAGAGPANRPWLLAMPPLWFLGLYEVLLGTSDPELRGLASTAGLSFVGLLVCVGTSYPLAFRRVMQAAVIDAGGTSSRGVSRRLAAGAVVALSRQPGIRATIQFVLASLGRAERHRFIVAASVGLAGAWAFPTWAAVLASPPTQPLAPVLGVSLSTMLFLIAGLRVAVGVPADVRASWVLDVRPPAPLEVHAALERAGILLVVVPIVLVTAPVYGWLWGQRIMLMHALLTLLVGTLLTELSLVGVEGIPCARRWDPDTLNLGKRWYVYLAGFLAVTKAIPAIEIWLFESSSLFISACVLLAGTSMLARWRARHRSRAAGFDAEGAEGELLGLN